MGFFDFFRKKNKAVEASEHDNIPDSDYENYITFLVSGTYYIDTNDKILLRDAKVGDTLKLSHESWNKHDKNAIAIHLIGKVGYVPAHLTDYFFTEFKQLKRHRCYIVELGGRIGDILVTAKVEFF